MYYFLLIIQLTTVKLTMDIYIYNYINITMDQNIGPKSQAVLKIVFSFTVSIMWSWFNRALKPPHHHHPASCGIPGCISCPATTIRYSHRNMRHHRRMHYCHHHQVQYCGCNHSIPPRYHPPPHYVVYQEAPTTVYVHTYTVAK